MKKGKKLGAIALCGIVSASALAGAPIVANNVSAAEITIDNFQTTYAIDGNGEVKIPQANSGTTMKVYPVGSSTEVVDLDLTDNFFTFKPTAPQYKIVYTNGTTEKAFIIDIDFKEATIELNESDVILPETTVKGQDVILPFAELKDSDGNKVDINYLNANEYSVSVTNKSTNAVSVVESDKQLNANVKYFKFKPENAGTYSVTYKITKSGFETVTKTYTVNVNSKMETIADISFKLNSKIGTPTIGEEFTLPTVKAKDNTNGLEGIKVKVDLSYQVMNQKGELSESVKIENFKFTPNAEGYYVFKYVVTDAFGNRAPVYTTKTAKVNDTQAPSNLIYTKDYVVFEGNAYEANAQGQKTDVLSKDMSYLIQSNLRVGDDFIIPAFYAKDNTSSDLTYSRTLKRYNNGLIAEEIAIDQDCTKLVKHNLTASGNYTLTYVVRDAKGNEANRDFNFFVYEQSAWDDLTEPTITFSAEIDESTKWGNKVSINKPAVIDLDINSKVSDTNCETHGYVFYKATKTGETDKTTKDSKVEIELNSSNKFEIQTYSSITELETKLGVNDLSTWDIFVCFEYTAKDDRGNEASEVKEIKVIGATEVPTLNYVAPATTPLKQGDEITIGNIEVSYSDAKFQEYLKDINVDIEIVNTQTNAKVLAYGGNYAFSGNLLTVSGSKFLASYSGDYKILISITDINGNTVIQETSITGVVVTYVPEIVLDKDTLELELGSTDESAKIYTMFNNGAVVEATDNNLEITVVSGSSVAIDSNKYFKAIHTGTSVVRYTMKNDDGSSVLDFKEITVTVKDTKNPELIFEVDNPFNKTFTKNTEITLPMPNVKDVSAISSDDVVVTVKRSGTDIPVTNNKFTPDQDGTYSVEYKVTDASGNSATKSFSINVGDVDGPKIAISNVPATKEVGSIYTLDLNDLDIYDEYEQDNFVISLGVNTFITMKDAEGNEIKSTSTDGYSYKLDKAGTYTLTIKATDGSNHTTTIDKTITVSEKEVEPEAPNTAGTVIAILASLLILAFVIIYFFKPEKGAISNKKKKLEKVEEKDKKDEE